MFLNGAQVFDVVTAEGGLLQSMQPGSAIIGSAPLESREIRAVAEPIFAKGIKVLGSPIHRTITCDNPLLVLLKDSNKLRGYQC